MLPRGTFEEYKAELKLVVKEPDGSDHSVIEFRSGDDPDLLRGFGVHFFVLDEAARMPEASFVSILTTITQTEGKGIIISTPLGRGWFYDVYRRGEKFDQFGNSLLTPGEEDPWPEWKSIRMPTWMNPYVKKETILHLKKILPEDTFRQEIAAEFLDGTAGVFRGIKECVRGVLQPPELGHQYVMGVDLARLRDFTVITVMDRHTKHVVDWQRFNEISWDAQYQRIISTARRYNNAAVVIDSTGIGDPIVNALSSASLNLVPYKISGTNQKKQLIDKLRVNIEQRMISYPALPILIKELEDYEYKFSESGAISFSAPRGRFDDCVISLAFAVWESINEPWVYRHSNRRGI